VDQDPDPALQNVLEHVDDRERRQRARIRDRELKIGELVRPGRDLGIARDQRRVRDGRKELAAPCVIPLLPGDADERGESLGLRQVEDRGAPLDQLIKP
jgi:hypothetical protein